MKNANKYTAGALSVVLALMLPLSVGNALIVTDNVVENNLSLKQTPKEPTARAVFVVSKPKSLIMVKKDLDVLLRYQNSTFLTDKDLKSLLHAVGFRGDGLVKAWAVAKKESNGRPLGFNGNTKTGDSSFGMFQINMIRDLGPDRRKKFGLNFSAELMNPVLNAQIAYHMSDGGKDWSAWNGITPRTKAWIKKFPY